MEWGFYAGGRRVGGSKVSLGLVRTETEGAMSTLPRDLISEVGRRKDGQLGDELTRTGGRRGAKTGAWVKRGGEEAEEGGRRRGRGRQKGVCEGRRDLTSV